MLASQSMLALLAATAAAQSIGSSCVGNSFGSTGCNPQDFKCICNSSGWIAGLSCCVSKACNMQEQQDTVNFAQQVCRIVQVNLPTMASCSSSASATPAPSGAASSAGSSAGSSAASATTSSGRAASSAASSGSSSAAAASPTMAAGSKYGVAGGVIGGAAVGAAALLL